MKTRRIFRKINRFTRRGEKRKLSLRPLKNVIKFLRRQLGTPRHIWQLTVDLADENKIGSAGAARVGEIEGGGGVALRRRDIEPATGEEEKFIDLDVWRQSILQQCFVISEGRITIKKASGNWL